VAPPSWLDFAGYVFFFPGLMVGPSFDFAEYRRWVTLSMFDVFVQDKKSKTGTTRKRRVPRSGIPATIKLAEGTFWLIMVSLFSSLYSVEFALSDEFLNYSFLRRFDPKDLINADCGTSSHWASPTV
jgi:lysophospholipid acyltransferase